MIDVHCHLQFKAFENDYEEIIANAFSNGITVIINTGTQVSSSEKAVEFADKYDKLYAIVGIHPHHADKIEVDWIKKLELLTEHKKVVGIGEIGLDYYSYQSNGITDPKLQTELFESQIELAHKTHLPLQIHNRHAGADIVTILHRYKNKLQNPPGMFHCFAGTKEVLKKALDLGFYIGFDGNITYKGLAPGETTTLSELAQYTPIDRIVLETDSPYLTPIPHRGTRNEPKYVPIIAEYIADLKKVDLEQLVEQTDKNVYTVFKLA